MDKAIYLFKIIEASVSSSGLIHVEVDLPGHHFTVQEVEGKDDVVSCSCGNVNDSHNSLAVLAVALTSISILLGRDISVRCYSYINRFSIVVDDILELLFDLEGETYGVLADRYELTSSAPLLTGALIAGVKDVISSFFKYDDMVGISYSPGRSYPI